MNQEIATQWFEKSKKEQWFNKFICLWISLNASYWDIIWDGDRNKCINYFIKHSEKILALEATPIFIDFTKNRPAGGIINIEKGQAEPIGEGEIDKIAKCLYTIRCNVFHGDKSLRIQDNLDLLDKSSNLLNEFLNIILN